MRGTPGTHSFKLDSINLSADLDQDFGVEPFFINALLAITGSQHIIFPHSDFDKFSSESSAVKRKFAFLKIIDKGATKDYLLFRGCIPSNITLDITTGDIAKVSYSFTPAFIGNLSQNSPNYFDINSANPAVSGYTFNYSDTVGPQSAYKVLSDFIISKGGTPYEVGSDSFTLSLEREVTTTSLLGSRAYQYMLSAKTLDVSVSGNYYFKDYQLQESIYSEQDYQISFDLINGEFPYDRLSIDLPITEISDISDPVSTSEYEMSFSATFSAKQSSVLTPLVRYSLDTITGGIPELITLNGTYLLTEDGVFLGVDP